MGYNGYTDKKKMSNEKYMKKLDSFIVRMYPEEKEKLDSCVKQSGKSRNAFILEAIKEKIDREYN